MNRHQNTTITNRNPWEANNARRDLKNAKLFAACFHMNPAGARIPRRMKKLGHKVVQHHAAALYLAGVDIARANA